MSPGMKRIPEVAPSPYRETRSLSALYISSSILAFIGCFVAIDKAGPSDPQYFGFKLVSTAVAALALMSIVPMWGWTAEMGRLIQPRLWMDLWMGAAMSAVFGFGGYVFLPHGARWAQEPGLRVLAGLLLCAYFSVGLPSAIGAFRGQRALLELAREGRQPRERVASFLYIRDAVGYLLLLCALGIGSATLPVGAWDRVTHQLPDNAVVLFGLYWSTFLAITYVPVYITLNKVGNSIRDETVPDWPAPDQDLAAWYGAREKLGQHLGLTGNSLDTPKMAFAVLAPLASGILSSLVGKAGS